MAARGLSALARALPRKRSDAAGPCGPHGARRDRALGRVREPGRSPLRERPHEAARARGAAGDWGLAFARGEAAPDGERAPRLSGCASGFGARLFTSRLLHVFLPPTRFPISLESGLNAPVFLFALAATGLVTVLCGVFPALQASRPDLVSPLKDASGTVWGGTPNPKFRSRPWASPSARDATSRTGMGARARQS